MDRLSKLENEAIYIIREAYARLRNIALLWSMGKDSTTLLWLARKAFFGRIPFPVIHVDTTYKFPEMYEFRDRMAEEWGVDLIIARNEEALKNGMGPHMGKLKCCTALKTEALKMTLERYGFKAILLGIRRDEHGIRSKERFFSPRDSEFRWNYRDQPPELWNFYSMPQDDGHLRVHPLLSWTEVDVWMYIKRENIPVLGMYFARNGKRYRSIGCMPCTRPITSGATNIDMIIEEILASRGNERIGRAQDKEDAYMMQKLRSLGYM